MRIGITSNTDQHEYRVALSPAGVHALTEAGHIVSVETNAGVGSGFPDTDYRAAGAEIVFTPEEIIRRPDVVLRVAPPTPELCDSLSDHQIMLSFFNYGTTTGKNLKALQKSGATAIAFELIEDNYCRLPILLAMSEIAGSLLPQIAGTYLQNINGGRGISLVGAPGIPAARVVILGAGIVGSAATKAFLAIGASVDVLDSSINRLRTVKEKFGAGLDTMLATPLNLQKVSSYSDVLIGAAYTHGENAPKLITEKMVEKMKPGSVIIDVAVDQGGCIETTRPTTHLDPVFIKHNVIHYCVPNIPSLTARTSSHALTNVLLPSVMCIAENGLDKALKLDAGLHMGLYMQSGKCTISTIKRRFGL